jgi:hypothetical protein
LNSCRNELCHADGLGRVGVALGEKCSQPPMTDDKSKWPCREYRTVVKGQGRAVSQRAQDSNMGDGGSSVGAGPASSRMHPAVELALSWRGRRNVAAITHRAPDWTTVALSAKEGTVRTWAAKPSARLSPAPSLKSLKRLREVPEYGVVSSQHSFTCPWSFLCLAVLPDDAKATQAR